MTSAIKSLEAVIRRANELVRDITALERQQTASTKQLEGWVADLQELFGPGIESVAAEKQKLTKELIALVIPRFDQLAFEDTKTIKLRHGQLSLIQGRDKLEVSDDEESIIRRIKRHGGLRKFTKLGKRTLVKDALKKDPAFVAKIKGLKIIRESSLIIRPTVAQGSEIVREADAFSVPLPKED